MAAPIWTPSPPDDERHDEKRRRSVAARPRLADDRNAAFEIGLVRAGERKAAAIGLAVFGIVDLSRPFVGRTNDRPRAFAGVGIVHVDLRLSARIVWIFSQEMLPQIAALH